MFVRASSVRLGGGALSGARGLAALAAWKGGPVDRARCLSSVPCVSTSPVSGKPCTIHGFLFSADTMG